MDLDDLLNTIAIALLWIFLYTCNHTLLAFTNISAWVSLLFIPSGFKAASAFILRSRAIPGLFIGSLATGFLFLKDFSTPDVLMFSLFSATLPYVALRLVEYLRPLQFNLSDFSLQHIALYSLCYAFLNSVFHFGYRYHILFLRDVHQLKAWLGMMVGDILGILFFMYFLAKTVRYLSNQLKHKK